MDFGTKLVSLLHLVSLASRTLLHAPLKAVKVVSVAKLLIGLSPKLLNLFSK